MNTDDKVNFEAKSGKNCISFYITNGAMMTTAINRESQQHELLTAIWSELPNFDCIDIWDLDMSDIDAEGIPSGPVINDSTHNLGDSNSLLQYIIPINSSNKDTFEKLIEFYEMPPIYASAGKFICAYNLDKPYRINSRMECYLINKHITSIKRFKIVIATIKIDFGDCIFKCPVGEHTISISSSEIDFNLIRNMIDNPPKFTDIDVQLILKTLDDNENKNSLFRGVNEYFYDEDGISSSNYRNNSKLAYYNLLIDHEQEIVNNLIKFRYYDPVDEITALTDLRHSGKDTNIIDFSREYKVSLLFACSGRNESKNPRELIILPKSELNELTDFNYQKISDDYIIHPSNDARLETKERVEIQSSEFVYCHKGFLSRNKYERRIKHLLIDESLKELLLSYSGFNEVDVYPDFQGFLSNDKNFETNASNSIPFVENLADTINIFLCFWDNNVVTQDSTSVNLYIYNVFSFLDMEIDDYIEPIITSNYALARVNDWGNLGKFFDSKFQGLDFNDAKNVKFILGSNSNYIEKFHSYINKTKPDLQSRVTPRICSFDIDKFEMSIINDVKNEKLRLSLCEFENINNHIIVCDESDNSNFNENKTINISDRVNDYLCSLHPNILSYNILFFLNITVIDYRVPIHSNNGSVYMLFHNENPQNLRKFFSGECGLPEIPWCLPGETAQNVKYILAYHNSDRNNQCLPEIEEFFKNYFPDIYDGKFMNPIVMGFDLIYCDCIFSPHPGLRDIKGKPTLELSLQDVHKMANYKKIKYSETQ